MGQDDGISLRQGNNILKKVEKGTKYWVGINPRKEKSEIAKCSSINQELKSKCPMFTQLPL